MCGQGGRFFKNSVRCGTERSDAENTAAQQRFGSVVFCSGVFLVLRQNVRDEVVDGQGGAEEKSLCCRE